MKKIVLVISLLLVLCVGMYNTEKAFASQMKNFPEADLTWSFVQGQELEVKAEEGTTIEILTPNLVSFIVNKGSYSKFRTDRKGDAYILFHQPTKGDFLYHLIIGGDENQIKTEVVSNADWITNRNRVVEGIDPEIYIARVVELVNKERTSRGIPPLRPAKDLMQAAAIRAEEISRYMSHTRPNGMSCQSMFPYGQYTIAENIAGGQSSPEWVVKDFMNSPGHRANMLKPEFTEIGVGYFFKLGNEPHQSHWVQMFRQPMPQAGYRW